MEYKLFHDNCLEIIKKIPNESIDLILTDIPYNISKENNFKTMKDRKGRNGIDFGEWDKAFNTESLINIVPLIKSGGSLVTFCSFEQYSELCQTFKKCLILKDKFIWEKSNPMPRNRNRRYVNNIELCVWFVKGKSKWTFNRQKDNYDSCVLKYPSESGIRNIRYHPCQKNINLIKELILRHSNPNNLILDPFMGSGTTGVACVHTNRNFIGIELDDKYFNVAKERIEKEIENESL